MVTRNALCAEALTWLNTPWVHHQHTKGAGCDCVGFPFGVAKALGLLPADARLPYYSPQWHLHKQRDQDELLVTILRTFPVCEVALEARQPGDILVFRWLPKMPCAHLGILLSEARVIHARSGDDLNRVLIQPLHGLLRRQLAAVFVFLGLDDA